MKLSVPRGDWARRFRSFPSMQSLVPADSPTLSKIAAVNICFDFIYKNCFSRYKKKSESDRFKGEAR